VSEDRWEDEGEHWVRWARTPGHDAYWFYRDAFFDDLLPDAGRRTLEIGCGEGRVARDLATRGHRVTAVDASRTLLEHARAAETDAALARCDAAALPFRDGSFDLVVSYNSLQVVGDMPATVREAARVLGPGGRFAICVSHPVTDLGRFLTEEASAPYVLRPNYFDNEWVDETVERDGLTMRFTGWTYSLEDYASALESAGFHITVIREPRPSAGGYEHRRQVPMFLLILARWITDS
jgi:ubiquinone/menaquinone biosynthesis C-methylase UbiE